MRLPSLAANICLLQYGARRVLVTSSNLTRLGGLAGMVAGLLYFAGYAGMAELLMPVMSNLGGHVVLGLAGLATLPALVGLLARDAGRSARLVQLQDRFWAMDSGVAHQLAEWSREVFRQARKTALFIAQKVS